MTEDLPLGGVGRNFALYRYRRTALQSLRDWQRGGGEPTERRRALRAREGPRTDPPRGSGKLPKTLAYGHS